MHRPSIYDLLTEAETAVATQQGWGLHHVADNAIWKVMILGNPNAERAGAAVVALARAGNALAQKALQLVAANKGNT